MLAGAQHFLPLHMIQDTLGVGGSADNAPQACLQAHLTSGSN